MVGGAEMVALMMIAVLLLAVPAAAPRWALP